MKKIKIFCLSALSYFNFAFGAYRDNGDDARRYPYNDNGRAFARFLRLEAKLNASKIPKSPTDSKATSQGEEGFATNPVPQKKR